MQFSLKNTLKAHFSIISNHNFLRVYFGAVVLWLEPELSKETYLNIIIIKIKHWLEQVYLDLRLELILSEFLF